MKYPSINKQPTRTITVPEMSGGINLRDSVTLVTDNQLTDSMNLWFDSGLLKTRPGLKKVLDIEYDNYTPATGDLNGCTYKYENTSRIKNGIVYQLVTVFESRDGGSRIRFIWLGAEKSGTMVKKELPYISNLSEDTYLSYFTVQYKKQLYCFCETKDGGDIFRINDDETAWEKLTDNDIYAPIIMTGCLPSGSFAELSSPNLLATGATMVEGYNLLGNYCRRIWSTYNDKVALQTSETNTTKRHAMFYKLMNDSFNFSGATVTAEITYKSGKVYTHSVTIPENPSNWIVEQTNRGDNIYLAVTGTMLAFFASPTPDSDERYNTAYVTENDYVENNLVITEPCPNNSENMKKVFAMQRSLWFGGDSKGISGGTRLFLCGNTEEKEKNLVIWSGLNNPLYFSENCYAYVGNSNQAVTAFGRQQDMLVIFKERETYLTQYMRNDSITADDLISQRVVDYTASNVYFPIIQLHTGIGCDCPDTVQLCRNRLVWACTDGNVYTLCNDNQYSERTIFKISGMVERKLKKRIDKGATSADFGGKYHLFLGKNVFVMDYESYGYTYIASYTKTEDAQLRIPWWQWELPQKEYGFYDYFPLLSDTALMLFSLNVETSDLTDCWNDYRISAFDDGVDNDNGQPIHSGFVTKIFDFGAPAHTKNVPLVNIAFGNNGGNPITVTFVTDKGERGTEEITLAESDEDEYSPEYVHNRQLRPYGSLITRFGIRVECEGVMSLSSLSLNYRLLGGARN